jgi:hypothetical protein
MARKKIPYQTDVAVLLEHPTDVFNADPLNFTDDGSTCSFKVFDPNADEVLSAAEAGGQVVLSVSGAGAFKVGHLLEVTLDSGILHDFTLSAVDPAAGTVTGSPALPTGAAAGNRVRRRLGSAVSMTQYGTPKLGETDWGFVGTLLRTHPGLVLGLEVDVEIYFVGAVGGGLDLLKVLCAVVSPVEDCEACS